MRGTAALASKGPLGRRSKSSPLLQVKLAAMLDEGPAAHGWEEDQVWSSSKPRSSCPGRVEHPRVQDDAVAHRCTLLADRGASAGQRLVLKITEILHRTMPGTRAALARGCVTLVVRLTA